MTAYAVTRSGQVYQFEIVGKYDLATLRSHKGLTIRLPLIRIEKNNIDRIVVAFRIGSKVYLTEDGFGFILVAAAPPSYELSALWAGTETYVD